MIKLNISEDYHEPKFRWNSPEFKEYVQQCADKLPEIPNERTTVIIDNAIYQISNNAMVWIYVVDANWGSCKRYYAGGVFESASEFVDNGGDVDLVTFEDKAGNTYSPIKKRKSVLMRTPDGQEFKINRGQAERQLR